MLRDFLAPKPRKQMKSEKPKAKDGDKEKETAKAGAGSIFDITQAQAAPEAAVAEQTKVGRIADHVSIFLVFGVGLRCCGFVYVIRDC